MYGRLYTRRARIVHYCCWCGAQILPGSIYTDTVFLGGGFVEHIKRHSVPDCPSDPDDESKDSHFTEPILSASFVTSLATAA